MQLGLVMRHERSIAQPITEGPVSKGGQNDPDLSSERPPAPGGSGGGDEFIHWNEVGSTVGELKYRVKVLEEENRLLKQKLLDIEAYFQSGRR